MPPLLCVSIKKVVPSLSISFLKIIPSPRKGFNETITHFPVIVEYFRFCQMDVMDSVYFHDSQWSCHCKIAFSEIYTISSKINEKAGFLPLFVNNLITGLALSLPKGSDGRTRTYNLLVNSEPRYRCATSEYVQIITY